MAFLLQNNYKIYGTNILEEKIKGIIQQNATKHNVYYLNIVISNIESELLVHYYIIIISFYIIYNKVYAH